MSGNQIAAPVRCVAQVATPQARRYLTQLCKHFQHRRPVELTEDTGSIAFDGGRCEVQAEAGMLTLTLDAEDDAHRQVLQDVVARHLLRFAFREDMQIAWRTA